MLYQEQVSPDLLESGTPWLVLTYWPDSFFAKTEIPDTGSSLSCISNEFCSSTAHGTRHFDWLLPSAALSAMEKIEKDPHYVKKDSHSDLDEKVILTDIDVLGTEIEPVPDYILDAAEYAQTMSAVEIEDTIRRIVDEHDDDPVSGALSIDNFLTTVLTAAKCYLFDEDLKQNPAEYQHVYDELKVEAAMIKIASPQLPLARFLLMCEPCRIMRRLGPSCPTTMTPASLRALSAPGLLAPFSLPRGDWLACFDVPKNHITVQGIHKPINSSAFGCPPASPNAKYPGISVASNVAQVLAYPAAKLLEFLPNRPFTTFDYTWSFNPLSSPGHFNWAGFLDYGQRRIQYALHIIWVQYLPLYFDQSWATGFGYQILVALSTNFIGYDLVGLTRRFPVYPASAIWYNNLSFHLPSALVVQLDDLDHTRKHFLGRAHGQRQRSRIEPNSDLDWNQLVPVAQTFIGTAITLPIIAALWYTNTWNVGYFPINSNHVYDNSGALYTVANAVGNNTLFDEALYATLTAIRCDVESFTVLPLGTSSSMAYFGSPRVALFGVCGHVVRHDFRVLIVAIALGAAGVGVYPTETSPAVVLYGALVVALLLNKSITNVQVTLNVLAELFGGLWFPGNAVAMNYFKDLKLAHYMHIPPYITFYAQMRLRDRGVVLRLHRHSQLPDDQDTRCLHPASDQPFYLPGINTFFTASVLWGTLGPKRMFGVSGIYNGLLYCFFIGAVLPIPVYLLRKWIKALEYLHLPVLLTGGYGQGTWKHGERVAGVPVGYFFNVFIKKRYLAWWSKYNYITTTAFSAAIAISAVVIFFALQWPGVEINWSGNIHPFSGCDGTGCPLLPIPESGTFGPVVGEFH
ncbi:OPT oligopeptide transporter protein-domain-containing protein [Mycena sp. CBHHK59/15]|nr:OPT oligopeptide transporter protein-domain-containing protein [Mycena sp. CBHHK59/15]